MLVAGVAAAVLISPPRADAYTPDQLPGLGYSTFVIDLGGGCHQWKASLPPTPATLGTDLGSDCDPGFQQRLDDFIAATCPCAQTTTAATTDPGTLPGTTTIASTVPITTTDASGVTTVITPGGTTTSPAQTVTVTTTVVDPTVEQRLTALEQRQAVDEQRIATLEARAGIILGEPKNVAPFTNAA
jgi:hypothetical protein